MKTAESHTLSAPRMLRLLAVAMLLLILYFGLHFKGAAMTNDVSRIVGQPGIHFSRSGIVYADDADFAAGPPASRHRPWSIELAMKPASTDNGHFRFLMLLHGGQDAGQLVIGQWRSWLVVMNGNDYDHSRRWPRISVDALQPDREHFVSVVSGDGGTRVFIDGALAGRKPDLQLKIPHGEPQRVVLGNSIYGRHAWAGDLYGLACYPQALDAATIGRHFDQWRRERNFAFARPELTAGLYLFDEHREQQTIVDHSGRRNHLRVPPKMTILTKEFLTAPFATEGSAASVLQDVVVNLVGFVPLGFLLSALLGRGRDRGLRHRLGVVMLACGTLSLGIELAQAWIPSRSSQMLDFILNTLGGGAGVFFHDACRFVTRRPAA